MNNKQKDYQVKILLVDDREDNLLSIETVLEKNGYIFRKARSGKEALKILLKEIDFTLILMDVQMPDLNGLDTASLIYERDKLKHIPIIFITANDYNEEFIFRGYETGAVDYIYKPINANLLRAKVAVFVELYKKNHLLLEHERELQRMNNVLEEKVQERTQELLEKNGELELINKELHRVNADLDSFVYAASHDLKAPVSNIEGLLFTLKDFLSPEALCDENVSMVLGMINESIARFKGTIKDLTEITKIQKNAEEEINQIDIMEVIDDVKVGIRDLIIASEAEIKINPNCSTHVNYSRKNMNSIFYNLLSNAIKYRSPHRIPKITINVDNIGEHLLIEVSDNGLGLKEEDKPKIFAMFKRLHNHVEGTGVGLYIVKRIIENSGGMIEVESEFGVGTKFKLYFKLNHHQQIEEVKRLIVA